MALNPSQYIELYDALLATFNLNQFETMFSLRLGMRLSDHVNVNQPFSKVVKDAIELSDHGLWTERLVQQAMAHFASVHGNENQHLKNFIQKYPSFSAELTQVEVIDYYRTCFVRAKRLFIAREHLRAATKQLREDNDSPRTFLVKGAPKSGKTYTRQLIFYLEDKPINGRNEIHKTIYIDLKSFIHDPFHIAETIGRRLPVDVSTIPERGAEQETAYAVRLVDWIHEQFRRMPDNTVYWIVVDHFLEAQLLKGTKELINLLSQRIEDEVREKCRLVILDYQDNIPVNIVNQSICETVEEIKREQLIQYFTDLFDFKKIVKTTEESEAIVETILKQVESRIAALPADSDVSEKRWEFLYEAINEAIQRYVS